MPLFHDTVLLSRMQLEIVSLQKDLETTTRTLASDNGLKSELQCKIAELQNSDSFRHQLLLLEAEHGLKVVSERLAVLSNLLYVGDKVVRRLQLKFNALLESSVVPK